MQEFEEALGGHTLLKVGPSELERENWSLEAVWYLESALTHSNIWSPRAGVGNSFRFAGHIRDK